MKSNQKSEDGVVTCPICQKRFVPAPEHRYKLDGYLICTYKCLCEGRRSSPLKRKVSGRYKGYDLSQKVSAVLAVVKGGKKNIVVAKEVGCSPATITRWLECFVGGEYDEYIKENNL